MNCCDYKCNQGRDCPARKTPADVAKIGQRYPAAEPLARPTWFDQFTRELAGATLAIVVLLLALTAVVVITRGAV
jgi:hypothetical protein